MTSAVPPDADPTRQPGHTFNYERAFSRNIGWVTAEEQQRLRRARVAIAGLGGVGGAHILTLSRLGVAHFNIADFDEFDVHNMNRQAGAFMSTMGHPKLKVMERMALDVNPESNIRLFPEGVQDHNLDDFLKDVDVYVDSLDLFVLPTRRKVFQRCRELGIPAMTAAPLGMGAALFQPDGHELRGIFQARRPPLQRPIRPVHRWRVARNAEPQIPGGAGIGEFRGAAGTVHRHGL
jgi:tRNA threonylcarbamoyladenosine dehydratase